MASETIIRDVIDFLQKYPPFSLMGREDLASLASSVSMQYFEEKERIFDQGDKPLPYFFVVNKGSIRIVSYQGEEEILMDVCDEGDIFGVRASIANDGYIAHAEAEEDSLLYTIPMEKFQKTLEANPHASIFLASGFASGLTILKSEQQDNVRDTRRFIDNSPARPDRYIEIDTIDTICQRRVIDCSPQHTVWQAAKIMTLFNVGSILVTDKDKKPLGIVTDTDFRRKVVSKEEPIKKKPISEIMSSPVKTIRSNVSVSEVMLMMINMQVSHLCVTEDGTDQSPALGVISQRDVLIAQGNNPAILAKQISALEDDVVILGQIREKAEFLVSSYLHQDIGIPFISNVITEINDLLIRKAVEIAQNRLAQEGLAHPQEAFCWLALGSEGRREQLLRTDQDNALVYENPPPEKAEEVKKYYLQMSEHVVNVLEACGFVRCSAKIMANNPAWCLSLAEWKKQFGDWIGKPDTHFLANANIFFDFRPVMGNLALSEELKSFVFAEIGKSELFLPYLAKRALQNPPPLSFFRSFIVEKTGKHKNEFDIKARALMPLVDAARVLAYDYKLRDTYSTSLRFLEVAELDEELEELCKAAAVAYEILLKQRAIQGLRNSDSGRYINPDVFNKIERQTIRNTFKTIEKVQQMLDARYQISYLP